MDIGKFVLTDEALNAIDNGVWVGDLSGAGDVKLFVTGLQRNSAAQEAIRTKIEAQMKKQRNKEVTSEQRADIVRGVLADFVLKDWKGFKQNGKELKYDATMARKWIMSRNGEGLAALVLEAAGRVDEDAASFVESVGKN